MPELETVKVVSEANKRLGYTIINADDFDPERHTLVDGETLPDTVRIVGEATPASQPAVDERLANLSAEQVEAALQFLAGADSADPQTSEDIEAAEKKAARAEYMAAVQKQPGPQWDAERIREELAAFLAQQSATDGGNAEGEADASSGPEQSGQDETPASD